MAAVTTDDVRHLAALSALALTDDEIDVLREDITNILSYVDQLSELDVSQVEPSYQVTGLSNISRDDIVEDEDISGPELVERLAPLSQDGQFKVPKVL